MAVIDLSITSQRKQVVDFTMPYMNTGSKQHYILLQSYHPIMLIKPYVKQITLLFWNHVALKGCKGFDGRAFIENYNLS